MATIHKRFKVDAPVAVVWGQIKRLDGVHELMSMLKNAELDGDRRVCTTADGGRLEELIVSVDDELRRVVYTITDSPFGLAFHSASWQAIPNDDGTTTFEWFTDVKPDEAAPMIAQVIDSERDNIVAGLARKAPAA